MKKILDFLFENLLTNLVKVLGISMVLIILLQIAGRFLMTTPFSWTEELSRFSFIWFAFLGSVLTLRKGMHLGVEFFYQRFSDKSRKGIDILISLFILLFGLILIKYGIKLVEIGAYQKSPVLRWKLSYVYLVIPITGVFYVIHSVTTFTERMKLSFSKFHTENSNQIRK